MTATMAAPQEVSEAEEADRQHRKQLVNSVRQDAPKLLQAAKRPLERLKFQAFLGSGARVVDAWRLPHSFILTKDGDLFRGRPGDSILTRVVASNLSPEDAIRLETVLEMVRLPVFTA